MYLQAHQKMHDLRHYKTVPTQGFIDQIRMTLHMLASPLDSEAEHRASQPKRAKLPNHCTSSPWKAILTTRRAWLVVVFVYLALPDLSIISEASPTKVVKVNNSNLRHSGQNGEPSRERRPVKVNDLLLSQITQTPSTTRIVKMFCRVGRFLAMNENGTISGTLSQGVNETFELQSYGPSIVRIRHVKTGFFIAMDRRGRLRAKRVSESRRWDTFFYQQLEHNLFQSFSSTKYYKENPYDMFIGLKRSGLTKNGLGTLPGQDSVQFLILPVRQKESKARRSYGVL
ncbi:fibroblast growth factor 9 isoform X3 [Nematostella vectensis]|nr:fibroblast growth factor 9 isoform X3 [Nematostella vectensis]